MWDQAWDPYNNSLLQHGAWENNRDPVVSPWVSAEGDWQNERDPRNSAEHGRIRRVS